jgi:hypothetical protein
LMDPEQRRRINAREAAALRLDRVAHPEKYHWIDYKQRVRRNARELRRAYAFGDLRDELWAERRHFLVDDGDNMSVWDRMLCARCTKWVAPKSDDAVGDLAYRWLRERGSIVEVGSAEGPRSGPPPSPSSLS